MRPTIVQYLNGAFGTSVFAWLVPTPAVVYAIMITTLLIMFVRRAGAAGLPQYHTLGAAIWAMVGGLLGARVLYLLLRADQVLRDPALLVNLDGGTMSWGAYVGGGAGFWLYLRRNGQVAGRHADVAASVLGLGPLIGRCACFLNGDDYGTPSLLPWAVSYPPDSYPFLAQVAAGALKPTAAQSLSLHPVQLYLAASGLGLFVLFTWLWNRDRAQWLAAPGRLFLLFGAAYGALRFGLEFFRGDTNRVFVAGLPDGQILALLTCLACVSLLLAARRGRNVATVQTSAPAAPF